MFQGTQGFRQTQLLKRRVRHPGIRTCLLGFQVGVVELQQSRFPFAAWAMDFRGVLWLNLSLFCVGFSWPLFLKSHWGVSPHSRVILVRKMVINCWLWENKDKNGHKEVMGYPVVRSIIGRIPWLCHSPGYSSKTRKDRKFLKATCASREGLDTKTVGISSTKSGIYNSTNKSWECWDVSRLVGLWLGRLSINNPHDYQWFVGFRW